MIDCFNQVEIQRIVKEDNEDSKRRIQFSFSKPRMLIDVLGSWEMLFGLASVKCAFKLASHTSHDLSLTRGDHAPSIRHSPKAAVLPAVWILHREIPCRMDSTIHNPMALRISELELNNTVVKDSIPWTTIYAMALFWDSKKF